MYSRRKVRYNAIISNTYIHKMLHLRPIPTEILKLYTQYYFERHLYKLRRMVGTFICLKLVLKSISS